MLFYILNIFFFFFFCLQNKASDYLVSLYHTYFDSSNWVLKHQAFLSITQFGVVNFHFN